MNIPEFAMAAGFEISPRRIDEWASVAPQKVRTSRKVLQRNKLQWNQLDRKSLAERSSARIGLNPPIVLIQT